MSSQLVFPGLPPPLSSELSQWLTPPKLAQRIVDWAGFLGGVVLEPSAGCGSFVDALLDSGYSVKAVEYDKACVAELALKHQGNKMLQVDHADFMAWEDSVPPSCREAYSAVMNPPYENGQDTDHIEKALMICHRVIALVRTVFLHGVDRHERIWSKAHLNRVAFLVNRPRFIGEVDGSPRHDFCVVDILPKKNGFSTQVEWWT